METTNQIRIESLTLDSVKTWILLTIFVVGNVLLPQLCHLVPNGGHIFLPIYFCTLIASYRYGWRLGVMTALLSPVVNWLLFEMPSAAVLPVMWSKGALLALGASYAAYRFGKVTLMILVCVVLFYQIVGCGIEALSVGNMAVGIHSLTMGIPGMIIQVLAGWLMLGRMVR